MISKENVKYSLSNLKKRKGRSALTIISIFVGITTIFVFMSFGLGMYSYVNNLVSESSADKVMIRLKGIGTPGLDDTFTLSEDDLKAVRKTPGVYEVSGMYYEVAEVKKGDENRFVFLIAFNPREELITELSNVKITKGRELQEGEKGKVVLGYNYLIKDRIFSKQLDVNDVITIQEEKFRIAGFYDPVGNPQDDSQIYVTIEQFEKLYDDSKGYNSAIARVDTSDLEKVIENVEKSLRKSRDLKKSEEDFFVSSFGDMLEQFTSIINMIVGFIILIALVSVVVSAINTANTMITSVLERTREIGVMKSVGARNSEIFRIFLFESGFLGFTAGVLGVLFGFVLTLIAGRILINLGWGFLQPGYSVELFLGCVLFATITGAISGVAPAVSASRTNPADTLRHE